jgi:hypothetical protein
MTKRALPLLALALLGAAPGSALAAPPKLAIRVEQAGARPVSFFTLRAMPGERAFAGSIVVLNQDRKSVTVDVDPVNAVTASNLGFAYDVRGKRVLGAARWTRLSTRRFTIPARGQAAVRVGAAIPPGAEPGDYLSGVGVEARGQREKSTADEKVAVSSAQRFVVGFQVSLPGPRNPEIAFTGAEVERQPAGVTFLVGARNKGNVILKDVEGWIRINRKDGRRVFFEEVGPGTFVTGTSIDISALARKEQPQEGDEFRVRAELRYPGGVAKLDENVTFGEEAAQQQEEFGGPEADDGIPAWVWAVIAAGVLLAAAALGLLVRRRRRRPLDREAALALLEREHERARTSGRPLSVAVAAPAPPAGAGRARLGEQIRRRLPGQARLADLGEDGLLVIAPDTGERGIAGLAEDLERALADGAPGESAPRIGTATATDSDTASGLLQRARPAATRSPTG